MTNTYEQTDKNKNIHNNNSEIGDKINYNKITWKIKVQIKEIK